MNYYQIVLTLVIINEIAQLFGGDICPFVVVLDTFDSFSLDHFCSYSGASVLMVFIC